MQNSTFKKIVSQKSCTINSTNKSDVRKYTNTNDLINPSSKYYLEECVGIKTGYTKEAKNCLISACAKNNLGLIGVVLGANQINGSESSRYIDSINLFKYGYSNFSLRTFATKDDILSSIEIANGTKDTRNLDLVLEDSVSGILNNSSDVPTPQITLKENVSAPIAKNAILGTVTYNIGSVSYTKNLLASHDVELDENLMFIFGILLILILALILILILFKNSKKKKNRKSKYYNL